MSKPTLLRSILVALLTMAALTATRSAIAADVAVGPLSIEHPWARPTDAMAKTAAAYLVIKNSGSAPDQLVSASTPVAESADVHETIDQGGMMKMQHVDALDIPANRSTALSPGKFHIMLFNPKQQLKVGQTFPMELTFAKAGKITVQVQVERDPKGGRSTNMDQKMGGSKMDDMPGMKH